MTFLALRSFMNKKIYCSCEQSQVHLYIIISIRAIEIDTEKSNRSVLISIAVILYYIINAQNDAVDRVG